MGVRELLARYRARRKIRRENRKFAGVKDLEQKFDLVYRTDHWGTSDAAGRRFCSGPGSDPSLHRDYIRVVSDLIIEKRAESVADVGCGDHAIGRAVLDRLEQRGHSVEYTGYDLVANLIQHHNQHHAGPTVRFVRLNIVEQRLPKTDFTMVREVFQHLRNADVRRALEHIARSSRWAVVTESHYDGDDFVPNLDLPTEGTLTRSIVRSGIDLTQPPFGLRAELILQAPGKHCVLKTLLIDFDRQVAE